MFDSFVLNIKCYSSNKKQIKNKKALNNGDISKKSCAKKSLAKFLYTQKGKNSLVLWRFQEDIEVKHSFEMS